MYHFMETKTKDEINLLSRDVVNAALAVHRELGPGLLEGVYHQCMIKELQIRQIPYQSSVEIPLVYKGFDIEKRYQLDLLVDNEIILELKAVDGLLAVHEAQLLTYLKITGKRLGFLMNFNVPLIKHGIKRMVYNL
jgi:GxxExxY protein